MLTENQCRTISWAANFYGQQQMSPKNITRRMLKTHTHSKAKQSTTQHSTAQNCSYDKYIIGNWKIEKSKKNNNTKKWNCCLFSLFLEWCMLLCVHAVCAVCALCVDVNCWLIEIFLELNLWLKILRFCSLWTNIFLSQWNVRLAWRYRQSWKTNQNWMSHLHFVK